MAAAVAAYYKGRFGAGGPTIVLCDPDGSACWLKSIRARHPTAVGGDLDTLMAGLACGEVSVLAWEILRDTAAALVSVSYADAVATRRRLAHPQGGDPALVAGESAVAGLAALMTLGADPEAARAISLGPEARVLVFGTEDDTDPELYRRLVGGTAGAEGAATPS